MGNAEYMGIHRSSSCTDIMIALTLACLLLVGSSEGLYQVAHPVASCHLVWEEKCWDEPRVHCTDVQKPVTTTHYVPKCHNQYKDECHTTYDTKVSHVPRQDCKQGHEQKCHQEPKQECTTVHVSSSKQVPEQKCSQVPEQKCTTTHRQHCSTEYNQECSTRYEQECSTEYSNECHSVTEKKCHTVNERDDRGTHEGRKYTRPDIHKQSRDNNTIRHIINHNIIEVTTNIKDCNELTSNNKEATEIDETDLRQLNFHHENVSLDEIRDN